MATSAPGPAVVGTATGTGVRPVMLLTLNTPMDPSAVAFAIDTAVETGAELLVCDAVPLAVGQPTSSAVRSFGDRDALDGCTSAAAEARVRGARVSEMLFHHPRPLSAAARVCAEPRRRAARVRGRPKAAGQVAIPKCGAAPAARGDVPRVVERVSDMPPPWARRLSRRQFKRDLLGLGQRIRDPARQLPAGT